MFAWKDLTSFQTWDQQKSPDEKWPYIYFFYINQKNLWEYNFAKNITFKTWFLLEKNLS